MAPRVSCVSTACASPTSVGSWACGVTADSSLSPASGRRAPSAALCCAAPVMLPSPSLFVFRACGVTADSSLSPTSVRCVLPFFALCDIEHLPGAFEPCLWLSALHVSCTPVWLSRSG
eukprot:314745-Prymnesium_polylepis.1